MQIVTHVHMMSNVSRSTLALRLGSVATFAVAVFLSSAKLFTNSKNNTVFHTKRVKKCFCDILHSFLRNKLSYYNVACTIMIPYPY